MEKGLMERGLIEEDFTNQIIDFIKTRFVGHEVYRGLTTIDRNVNGLGIGTELKARGSAKITDFSSFEGSVKRIQVSNYIFWIADPFFKTTYRYQGQTSAELWTVPGGAIVDHPWGDVHPRGTIISTLVMKLQEQITLHLEYQVDPEHDDRPGHFLRDYVVPLTTDKLELIIEEFTGSPVHK